MNPFTKLEAPDVLRILLHLQQGRTQAEVAELFGVSQQTISAIKTGRRWSEEVRRIRGLSFTHTHSKEEG